MMKQFDQRVVNQLDDPYTNKMISIDKSYKAIIVDDDPQNILMLEHIVNEFFNAEFELLKSFENSLEALKFINSEHLDVVFLDIEMPELNGFDLIKAISSQSDVKIILVSSFDQYALKAFKHSVFDFLKKPVTIGDLRECINRLNRSRSTNAIPDTDFYNNILVVNRQDKSIFLDISNILRMEASGSYTDIFLEDGSKVNSTKKINYYESLLAKQPFYKLHRSHLINLNKIREIVKNEGDGMVVMQDGSKIEISRAKKDEFLRMFIKDRKM